MPEPDVTDESTLNRAEVDRADLGGESPCFAHLFEDPDDGEPSTATSRHGADQD